MTSQAATPSSSSVIRYVADGNQAVFYFPFPIYGAINLQVLLGDAEAKTGFTILGEKSQSGGSVTFLVPPATGTRVTLRRRMDLKRLTCFNEGGALRAVQLNDEFDYQLAVLQQLDEAESRGLAAPPHDPPQSLQIPMASERAGKALAFDGDGRPIAVSPASAVTLAENVMYQPGKSGAVSRTLSERLSDVISVLDFGADPDGASDSTAAIQAAFDALPDGGTLLIPNGTYRAIGLVFSNRRDILILGNGWLSPAVNAGTVLTIGGDEGDCIRWRGHLKVGNIQGTFRSNTVTGIKVRRLREAVLGLDLAGLDVGIDFEGKVGGGYGPAYDTFLLGSIYNNRLGILVDRNAPGSECNELTFVGGRFGRQSDLVQDGDDTWFIRTGNTNSVRFLDPSMETWRGCASIGRVCRGTEGAVDGSESVHIRAGRVEGIQNAQPGALTTEPLWLDFGPHAYRCAFIMGHAGNSMALANHGKAHGAATRVDAAQFRFSAEAGDLRKWFWPGAPIEVSIAGAPRLCMVRFSYVSGGQTHVHVSAPIIAGDPDQVKTHWLVNEGDSNGLSLDGWQIPGYHSHFGVEVVSGKLTRRVNAPMVVEGTSAGIAYPAVTFLPNSSGASEPVARVLTPTFGTSWELDGLGRMVAASYYARVGGDASAVLASRGYGDSEKVEATGANSAVIASSTQNAVGTVHYAPKAIARGAAVLAAASCEANHTETVVVASQGVRSGGALRLCGGYAAATSAPSTAARTWELNSMAGTIITDNGASPGTLADYAEYFENALPDTIGLGTLVTREGAKVRAAQPGERVCGIVSATAGIVLNDSPLAWAGRYLRGEFGEFVWHEVADPAWEPAEGQSEADRPIMRVRVENPDFAPERPQVPRSQRPEEWTLVGLLGQIHVRIDEAVTEATPFIAPGVGGRGTASEAETRIEVMQIKTPYDAAKGYGVALCFLR